MTYGGWLKRYETGPQWPERLTLVGCLWEDAAHSEDSEESGTILSFISGVVVGADSKALKVAFEVFEDRSTRDVTTVPASLVRKVFRLGRVDFGK